MNKVRIDKWLWTVRIYKTRGIAAEACKSGKIKHQGAPVKTSKDVRIGDIYEITIDQLKKTIHVLAFPENRVPAKEVIHFMEDLTPEEEYERLRIARQFHFEKRDRGSGRPSKKERRDIEDFKCI